jgi:Mg2+-importing ATPase
MAVAAWFLPFLPMLPVQVLLNNLLYDLSELGIPFDHVDAEAVAKPAHWDLGLIRRAMLLLGPLSSAFDLLTFGALYLSFGSNAELFRTGWFVESLATQCLVVFVVRSWRAAWRSHPDWRTALPALLAVAFAAALPLMPFAGALGFAAPPPLLYLIAAGVTLPYLLVVEFSKRLLHDA